MFGLTINNKRQKILVIILISVILITVLILLWNYWPSSTTYMPESEEVFDEMLDEEMLNTEFNEELDSSVLKDSRLDELKSHGQLPVEPGQTGRSNPFEQF